MNKVRTYLVYFIVLNSKKHEVHMQNLFHALFKYKELSKNSISAPIKCWFHAFQQENNIKPS